MAFDEFDEYFDDDTRPLIGDELPEVPIDDLYKSDIATQKQEIDKTALVDAFYKQIKNQYSFDPGKINYDQFKISGNGEILYWVVGDKKIRMTRKISTGGIIFLSLSSLKNEYNRLSESGGGAQAIRTYLGFSEYTSKIRLSKKAANALQDVNKFRNKGSFGSITYTQRIQKLKIAVSV